jgi:hypothetical protein
MYKKNIKKLIRKMPFTINIGNGKTITINKRKKKMHKL